MCNSQQNGAKIEIRKPITEPQKLPKGNGSSVVRDVKPGLR